MEQVKDSAGNPVACEQIKEKTAVVVLGPSDTKADLAQEAHDLLRGQSQPLGDSNSGGVGTVEHGH